MTCCYKSNDTISFNTISDGCTSTRERNLKATDFDELSDELSFDFVDKNGNEAKYVEIMDIDVDNLLEQIDNGTLEVSDPCAYWLVEGWLIAYFARVNGTDEDALISWLENDSHTVTRNSFQAFWVVVK